MGSRTVDCRKFSPNIFNKSKCSHCFRQREEHSAAALECNRASRKVSKCGYLFVAPDWDFSNPLYRTKRWQRRWFVLYDDGELTYSVDEHAETIPQACIDMTKVIEVTTAEDVTGHTNSLAITAPDRVTFVKGTCPEEAKWWLNVLGAFPKTKGRHKRNATFPGGQATTIISTQVQTKTSRNRHNSYHPEIIQSPTTVTPLTVVNIDSWKIPPADENDKNVSNENSTSNSGNINSSNSSRVYIDQPISSKSPPTRDKLYPEGKAQTRIRNRNRNSNNINNSNNNNSNANGPQQQTQQPTPPTSQDSTDTGPCLLIEKVHCDDKLKDIANTLTTYNQNRWNTTSSPIIVTTAPVITDIIIADEKPTRDVILKSSQQQNRPQSLSINTQQSTAKSSAPSIVSAIVKKKSGTRTEITSQNSSSVNSNISNSNNNSKQQHNERGDPDGGCNLDDMPVNYLLNKNQELRVNIPSDEVILNSKKGWLMKQDSRGGEWTRHWFTLHGAALFYYRDPVAEERGVLDGVLDVNSLTGIQETQLQQNYGFQLMTWDNRRIILATVSSNIRNNWINVLKTAAGLTTKKETSNTSTDKNSSDQSNTTDDLKICEIEKNNSNSSSNSNNNSTVVVNTSSNSNNTVKSPITPLTPKSILFSSDEEYRTASEGGRRDSVDWGSPISTSPPIPLTAITTTRTKDRLRSRSNSNSPRLYGGHNVTQNNKRSRSSPPTSRRSTIDSVGSDEMIIIHPVEEEIGQIVDPEIELRLVSAEKELSLLKGEAQEQENRVTTLITTLEKTETDLTKRIREAEKARDNLGKQLTENKNQAQDYIERLTLELEENHKIIRDLEDKLARGIEENEIMYKKLNNLENNNQSSSKSSSISSLNRIKMNKRMSSLSDLTSLSEFDPFTLERDYLAEEYNELKHRFEKAVHEIKLMKKELKEAQNQYDSLEIVHAALKQDLECRKVEDESQNNMMAARIQDLTSKYYTAERQVRSLKSKLAKSTEKRRSLSLKGRESLSLPKEFEEKVIELENKIDAIEGNSSKTEDRVSLKKSSRLRRKSLDNSSISSEPIQVLLRLNTLEKRVDNHSNESINSNTNNNSTNIHQNQSSSQSPKMTDHLIDRLKSLEGIVIATRDRIEQSLGQLQNLKSHTSHRTRRSVSPITDKKDTLKFIEKCLSEAGKMLKDSCENCVISSAQDNIILLPETSPIKLALVQLEAQLRTKLNDLLKQRRMLRERNELYQSKDLELLAERIAFESVVFGKLRESIVRGDNNTSLEYGEKETRSEISETSQLLALLKLKLGGKCSIKPNGSIDILASVLARRLVLSARRIGKLKIPEITPVNSAILDELLRQQNELNVIVMRYKNNAIETLSSGLAAETLNYISSNDAIHGAVQEAWRQAQETVNSELIQSEISNIMLRHAERYENLIIPSFGYTLTHSERITFENFADSVQDTLRKEMDLVITQLNKMYEEYLDKMKKGQWNIHLSQDHNVSEGRQLLCEFADIVAHKALIDARINILKGEYTPPHLQPATTESPSSSLSASPSSKDKLPSKDLLVNLSKLQKYENLFSELAENLEISNPDDILAEADFNFLYKYFCYDNLINKVDLNEISNSVIKLENSIINLEKLINNNNNNNSEINNNISGNDNETLTFKNIYVKNNKLIGRIDSITEEIKKLNLTNKLCPNCKKLEKSLVDTKSLYDNKIVELNQNFEANQAQLKLNLSETNNKMKLLNDDKLLIINELSKKTQLIVKFEAEIKNLNSKINLYQIDINNKLTEITKLNSCRDDCTKLKMENKTLQENLDKEKERIKKLEKHLEYLENEHQIHIEQIQENFNGKFIINNNDSNNNHENSDDNDDDDNLVSENNLRNEESLRKRYQKEIEQLRALCEKGLAAMESSHRRIIAELGEKHRNEIQELLSDKEQALAEETQATLAALDAMRKAHQNEVQREVTRFKQEFIKQFQLGGNTLADPKEKEHELEDVRLEILSLSEKYSSKCVEAASLEDKLKMATQQIKQSQHIIHQLEMRNKQLRAHLMSDDVDVSSVNSITASKDTNPANVHDERNLRKSNSVVLKQNQGRTKHEIQPRINSVEEVNFASVYTPVYNPSSLLTSLGSCESLNALPQSSSEGFIPPASAATNTTTTKIISPKSLTMKLRLNRNGNNNNNNVNNTLLSNINNNHNNNNNNLENSYEGEYLKTNANKLLCSPPPLNGKDVEHLRNFELEI